MMKSLKWFSRTCLFPAAASVLAVLFCGMAFAQGYPSKPIRLFLPFAPGAPSDMTGRTITQKLSQQMGQNFIAENRPGYGGNLALRMLAEARPPTATPWPSPPPPLP